MEKMQPMSPLKPLQRMHAQRWWPTELGTPASSGSSGEVRYAYFPDRHRLLIERAGETTLFDTAEYEFRGAMQTSAEAGTLSFMSQRGPVEVSSLKAVA